MPARKPEECDVLFGEYMNAGDLEALLALYEPTCALVQSDGGVLVGTEAIRANFTRVLAMKPRIEMAVVKVVSAGDGLALVYNDWRMTAKGPDGQPVTRAGRALEVMRRQPDGTWRVAADDPFARGRGDA